ncbi:hypothetical protein BS78_04G244300 [Paspalum vaginatum]|nr:hypothetical protein BS78_04G244300 [Paspalum vaginatum]
MVGSSVEGGADGDGGCCGVGDTSPGTIVWVRRRNGSWWPGRILGPEELPPSQIMSPRSGTPVKLLGREDASVDWYNLEKSKRVKAFRCGEFDACIEKAEATQGTLVKKREKYARREDAILHALELERKQLGSKYQTHGLRPGPPVNISVCTKHRKDLGSTRYKSKKNKKRKDASVPPDIKKEVGPCFLHAGSKRNFSESLAQGNVVSNHMGDLSHLKHSQGGATLESKERSTIVKKNKSDGSDFEDTLVSKSDRRRPLAQVLQSSENSPHHFQQNDDYGALLIGENNNPSLATSRSRRCKHVYMASDSGETQSQSDLPYVQMASAAADFEKESYLQHPGYFSEEQTSSDFVEKQITESSERECSESETEDDAELLQNANVILPKESHTPDPYSAPVSDKFGHMDYDDNEVTYSTYMPQLNESEEEDGSSELGVSQWHMKGKRNSRNAPKRLLDMTDGNTWLNKYNGSLKGSLHKTNGGTPRKESMQTSGEQFYGQSFYHIKGEPSYDSDETDLFEDTSHSEANVYRGRYPSSLRTTRDLCRGYRYFNEYENDSSKFSPRNKDTERIYRVDQNAYWDGPSFYQRKFTSRFGGMGPMLLDVNLKVQASYQGEHVPLVSLMSRLNGKAIVGHPIQIEILEDGSTDHLVFYGDSCLQDNTAAPPAWPTGRRTAMQRVPRSNPSGALLDADNEGSLVYSDWEMKPTLRKYSSSSNHQVKANKKSSLNARRSSAKSHKKSSKKANLSSQKVRALSSISTGKKHHGEGSQAKAHWRNDIFGGLIRSQGAVPLVTCVPAKVVFTRILEAVGRPPLSVTHRVRMASPSVRDPP